MARQFKLDLSSFQSSLRKVHTKKSGSEELITIFDLDEIIGVFDANPRPPSKREFAVHVLKPWCPYCQSTLYKTEGRGKKVNQFMHRCPVTCKICKKGYFVIWISNPPTKRELNLRDKERKQRAGNKPTVQKRSMKKALAGRLN